MSIITEMDRTLAQPGAVTADKTRAALLCQQLIKLEPLGRLADVPDLIMFVALALAPSLAVAAPIAFLIGGYYLAMGVWHSPGVAALLVAHGDGPVQERLGGKDATPVVATGVAVIVAVFLLIWAALAVLAEPLAVVLAALLAGRAAWGIVRCQRRCSRASAVLAAATKEPWFDAVATEFHQRTRQAAASVS